MVRLVLAWAKKRTPVSMYENVGFTIVELLVVIVVIGILAAISVVAYNGVQTRAASVLLQSDVKNAGTLVSVAQADSGSYPNPTLPSDIKKSEGTSFQYTSNGTSYCLTGTSSRSGVPAYMISSDNPSVREGVCSGHTPPSSGSPIAAGDPIQLVTTANCPTTRTMFVDARDNRTYWVQKLTDNKCWMLTSLAYAGGGTNTYGDVKALTNSNTASYTTAYYMIPTGANPTTNPTQPSTSTSGTGQYGYLYNWCAAMGGQATAACSTSTSPVPDVAVSICPAGWRLPTSGSGSTSEFNALNTAVNGGLVNSDAGLRTNWFGQRNGYWEDSTGFYSVGGSGFYWSSTVNSANYSYASYFANTVTNHAANMNAQNGLAVRCIAS